MGNIALSINVSSVFFTLFPVTLFNYITEMSQKYAYEDFVLKVNTINWDGEKPMKTYSRDVNVLDAVQDIGHHLNHGH